MTHTGVFFRTQVKAQNGLGADTKADTYRRQNHGNFHDNTHGAEGNVTGDFCLVAVVNQRVVHDHLHDAGNQRSDTRGNAQREDFIPDTTYGFHISAGKAHVSFSQEVVTQHHGGNELCSNGSDGSAFHAPIQYENINGVQNGVQGSADEDAVHGHTGVSVCTCHVGQCNTDDTERYAHKDDGCIVDGVRHGGFRCAEQCQNRFQENQTSCRQQDTQTDGNDQQVIQCQKGFPFSAFAQSQSGVSAAAGADEGSKSHDDGHQRESDGSSSIPQIAHTLTDEDLVYDVIHGVDQTGNDGRDGKRE